MENESQTTEKIRDNDVAKPEPGERRASSLPLILTVVSLLVWFGFQTVQLVLERSDLSQLKGNLEAAMQESQKTRVQLEALVIKTAELASQGNASAKTVVEELERKGIPIKAAAPSSK
jgi:ABC-type transporter Mla subunit MlaD